MEVPVHELGHGTPFRSRKLNSFFNKVFCFISWSNGVHYHTSHRMHHLYTCNQGIDYEIVLTPMKKNSVWVFYRFIFDLEKFIHRMKPNIMHVFGSTKADFFHWNELFSRDDPRREKMILWSRLTCLGHGLLIAAFIYTQQYILILIVNFPTFFATWLMHGCGMLQHEGLNPKAQDWRENTYSFRTGPLIGYLYWQMQYHLEHHTYAAVPFYNLKKLHRLMAPHAPAPLRGYFSGLMHLYKIMLRQNKDPSYYYIPELPALERT
ncbi:uncharacterized protein LOC133177595 [Saccostrea echinata]|uniref:uncharacterized protein LOC133177595 n=1 Tax=Saccostrea echinata TaxID=191078 RepID=UPI002A823CD3|nr:uncharacterized protein LOC133177595 [Saccostrea echinata]